MNRRSFLIGLLASAAVPKVTLPPFNMTATEVIARQEIFYEHFARSELWNRQIKEILLDELNSMKFVRILGNEKERT